MQKLWAALGLMSALFVCGEAKSTTLLMDVAVTPGGLELGSPSIFKLGSGTSLETFNTNATPLGKTGSYSTPFASFSGGGVIVKGSSPGNYAAPWLGPVGFADPFRYLEIGANQSETISFSSEKTAFGLYWGSVDAFNSITFLNNGQTEYTLTGAQLQAAITSGPKLTDGGGQSGFTSNGFVTFSVLGLGDFNEVVLSSTANAFEVADLEAFGPKSLGSPAPAVPETSTWLMMILGFFSVGFATYRRKGGAMELRIA
jgi:hypothetical protein